MKLLHVRKGQFVYHNNELHKVYSVKPILRESVHLYRLKDMKQVLTNASSIRRFQPAHRDSFIFKGDRYTVDKDKIPERGDYIMIVKPAPDLLDHYALNEIEKVDKAEERNVVTTRSNGVKHHEYVVLVPGKAADSRDVAYFDRSAVSDEQVKVDESYRLFQEAKQQLMPDVGDVYYDTEEGVTTLIVAVSNTEITFGHGHHIETTDFFNEDRYNLIERSDDRL